MNFNNQITLRIRLNDKGYSPSTLDQISNLLKELQKKRILFFDTQVKFDTNNGVSSTYILTCFSKHDKDILTEYNMYGQHFSSSSSFLQYLRTTVPLILTYKYLFSKE